MDLLILGVIILVGGALLFLISVVFALGVLRMAEWLYDKWEV